MFSLSARLNILGKQVMNATRNASNKLIMEWCYQLFHILSCWAHWGAGLHTHTQKVYTKTFSWDERTKVKRILFILQEAFSWKLINCNWNMMGNVCPATCTRYMPFEFCHFTLRFKNKNAAVATLKKGRAFYRSPKRSWIFYFFPLLVIDIT